jgi:hypothetical protein
MAEPADSFSELGFNPVISGWNNSAFRTGLIAIPGYGDIADAMLWN